MPGNTGLYEELFAIVVVDGTNETIVGGDIAGVGEAAFVTSSRKRLPAYIAAARETVGREGKRLRLVTFKRANEEPL